MNRHREYYLKNQEKFVKEAAERYQSNRDKILKRAKDHRSKKRSLINNLALAYGCQNPNCAWQGEYHPAMLEFHHFDPKLKQFQIGRAADYGYKAIASEINKCVVLCACCHALYHVGLVELNESMLCKTDSKLGILIERKEK